MRRPWFGGVFMTVNRVVFVPGKKGNEIYKKMINSSSSENLKENRNHFIAEFENKHFSVEKDDK